MMIEIEFDFVQLAIGVALIYLGAMIWFFHMMSVRRKGDTELVKVKFFRDDMISKSNELEALEFLIEERGYSWNIARRILQDIKDDHVVNYIG